MGGCCCARHASRADARTCATGRRRWPCTCCDGCCAVSPRSSEPVPASRKERPGSPRARLFVAMDLPEDARAALAGWREQAFAGREDVRLAAVATLHVTLVFLGWMAEKEIPRIVELTRTAIPASE